MPKLTFSGQKGKDKTDKNDHEKFYMRLSVILKRFHLFLDMTEDFSLKAFVGL